MKKNSLLIFLFVSALFAFSSPEKDKVVSLLKAGKWPDYVNFYNSIVKVKGTRFSPKMMKTQNRQLIGSYFEEVYVYTKTFPSDSSTYLTEHLLIGIIRNETQIVFYRYFDYLNNEWKNSHPIEDSVKTELSKMEEEFYSVYHSNINSADFFHAPVYGHRCGIDGVFAEYAWKLDSAVKEKKVDLLDRWLRSPSLEIQCYGVEGFFCLKSYGIFPNEEQRKLITIIKNKKGKVSCCQGCVYDEKDIGEILKPFTFDSSGK